MADASLSDFLRQQKAQQQQVVTNSEEFRMEWIRAVHDLIEMVQGWLRVEREGGLLDLVPKEVVVDEERLGSYRLPALDIKAAGRVVALEPIARIIIGGLGRVDLVCGPKRLLLVRNAQKQWFISSHEPRDNGHELNEHTFSEALKLMLS